MTWGDHVHFTRHRAEVEIRFKGGNECCEWCNYSTVNNKRHFECKLTREELVSPKDSIGWDCPLRKRKGMGKDDTDVSGPEGR